MSFLRHWRSIVRWVLFHKPEAKWCSTSPLPLIGMMSRSHLFLSGLVSTRARLRFGGRFYLLPIGRIRKPGRHKVAHFSTGTMPHFQPELTVLPPLPVILIVAGGSALKSPTEMSAIS